MSALVKKEIRLLRPAYLAALLLAVCPVWLITRWADYLSFSLIPFLFGAVMLALSSFGREFALGTFSIMLTQPLELRRIWTTKIALLAAALATVYGAWFLSCVARTLSIQSHYQFWPRFEPNYLQTSVQVGAVAAAAAFAGGLWTTLLLRQTVTSFWATVLVPCALVGMVDALTGSYDQSLIVLCLYAVVAFLFTSRLFPQVQEVAWTGGVINPPQWRPAGDAAKSTARIRRPWAALIWKEVQFYQVCLAGMAVLFLLHLGVVAFRNIYSMASVENSWAGMMLRNFGGIWFVASLVAGCQSVAEERRLGVLAGQLCLPFSSFVQFSVKLLFALAVGGLLSAGLYWTAEEIGRLIGAPAGLGLPDPVCMPFLWIALIGFYASTLSRGLLEALALSVGLYFAGLLLGSPFSSPNPGPNHAPWDVLWPPTFLAALIWAGYSNFIKVSENRRAAAARNILIFLVAIAFVILAVFAMSAARFFAI